MSELTLDKSNKKILGVCSGLAKYLDVDVTLLRVLFIFFTFLCAGLPILLYLIIALVAPDETGSTGAE